MLHKLSLTARVKTKTYFEKISVHFDFRRKKTSAVSSCYILHFFRDILAFNVSFWHFFLSNSSNFSFASYCDILHLQYSSDILALLLVTFLHFFLGQYAFFDTFLHFFFWHCCTLKKYFFKWHSCTSYCDILHLFWWHSI